MIHLLNEENSELRHRKFALPDGIRKHLQNVLNSYNGDKTANGYQRLTNILKMDGIMYNEMKRIKNFFDNYKGSDIEFYNENYDLVVFSVIPDS